jgi:hypothetical protein
MLTGGLAAMVEKQAVSIIYCTKLTYKIKKISSGGNRALVVLLIWL